MITLYASIIILLISVALLSITIYRKNKQLNIVCCKKDKEYDFWKSTSCNLISKFACEINRLEDEKKFLERTHKSSHNPSVKVKRVKW